MESVVNPQGSAQLMISVEICPPGAFDLEAAKPGLHGMWATTLPKFQSYGSWVTTVLRCHTIPYHTIPNHLHDGNHLADLM